MKEINSNYHSGFIAIVGRPNAGKSTLLNAIMQDKIAITSHKPQTTRDAIRGILTTNDSQYVFIDTPGIHKPKHALGKALNKQAYQALHDVDLVYWVIDGTQPIGGGDEFLKEVIIQSKIPCFLCINKIDLLQKEAMIKMLNKWHTFYESSEIFPISAIKRDNIDLLLEESKSYMSGNEAMYPVDMKCDHDIVFYCSEIIREKVLRFTQEEVPHAVAVVMEKFEEVDNGVYMSLIIVVELSTQKAILIGKQADMIRRIRLEAQKECKEKFHKKVEMELYVRVEKNWRNKQSKLQQFGYGNE